MCQTPNHEISYFSLNLNAFYLGGGGGGEGVKYSHLSGLHLNHYRKFATCFQNEGKWAQIAKLLFQ